MGFRVALALAVGVGFVLAPPEALAVSPTNFDFSLGTNGVSSFDIVVDGITLRASNFVSDTNKSLVDSDGLCFVGTPSWYCEDTSSLTLTFDSAVKLVSYKTGFNSFDFDVNDVIVEFAQGSNFSIQKNFEVSTTNSFTNQFYADANIPVVVSRLSTVSGGSMTLLTLTVEKKPVAVPGPLPFAGAAIAFGYSRRLRLRNSQH